MTEIKILDGHQSLSLLCRLAHLFTISQPVPPRLQVLNLCHTIGVLIHNKKSELIPKQKFLFLGYQFDLVSFQVTRTLDRYHNIKVLIHSILLSQGERAHTWQILLGLFASTEKLVPLGWQHTFEAQHCISQHWEFDTLTSNFWIPLSPTVEEDLQWWKSAHIVLRGAPVTLTEPDTQLFTEASKYAAEAYGSDSAGYFRKFHCSQQAGRNTVNTAVQTDLEATPQVSVQPNSASGIAHPGEIERPCRHPVTPFPDVRYRMVYIPSCFPSTDSGMGNPIIGYVCNEVESQTSNICVSRPRPISHGSRCSVNELVDTVGIRIRTTNPVNTGARESTMGPV